MNYKKNDKLLEKKLKRLIEKVNQYDSPEWDLLCKNYFKFLKKWLSTLPESHDITLLEPLFEKILNKVILDFEIPGLISKLTSSEKIILMTLCEYVDSWITIKSILQENNLINEEA